MSPNPIDVFFEGRGEIVNLAKMLYLELRHGEKLERNKFLGEVTQPTLTKAIKLLEDILRRAAVSIGKEKGFFKIIQDADPSDSRYKLMRLNYVNPLEYVLYVKNIEQYYLYLKTSMETFPEDIESFMFEGVNILDQVVSYKNTELRIIADNDYQLNNKNLLSDLYNKILNHKVIKFDYRPYGKQPFTVKIHPHILKEYNGRWFLFGYTWNDKTQALITHFFYAIDRIISKIEDVSDEEYKQKSVEYYRNYFNKRIGVSNIKGKPVDVVIHTLNEYGHGLIVSKKFHHSLEEISPFDVKRGYGEVKLHVGINNELIIRLISLIDNIEIVEPQELRIEIGDKLEKMFSLYRVR